MAPRLPRCIRPSENRSAFANFRFIGSGVSWFMPAEPLTIENDLPIEALDSIQAGRPRYRSALRGVLICRSEPLSVRIAIER
jgi:hypothetical protein